jgi:hypothetical protein
MKCMRLSSARAGRGATELDRGARRCRGNIGRQTNQGRQDSDVCARSKLPAGGERLLNRLLQALLLLPLAAVGAADDPCAAFSWEVSHERALFGERSEALVAGRSVASAPKLTPDRLYELHLSAQSQVTLAAPPLGHRSTEGAYAGLARLSVPQGGLYRVSLDRAAWVDVVADGLALQARDFQGRPGCNAPHKIVEFLLPAAPTLTLQLSGGTEATVKVALSRSPQQP